MFNFTEFNFTDILVKHSCKCPSDQDKIKLKAGNSIARIKLGFFCVFFLFSPLILITALFYNSLCFQGNFEGSCREVGKA